MNQISTRVSLRAAINANCQSCVYDRAESGSWRKQVENCTITACSLHPVRPLTLQGKAADKEKAQSVIKAKEHING